MWCVGLESISSGFLLLDVHVQLSRDRVPKWVGKGGGGSLEPGDCCYRACGPNLFSAWGPDKCDNSGSF